MRNFFVKNIFIEILHPKDKIYEILQLEVKRYRFQIHKIAL